MKPPTSSRTWTALHNSFAPLLQHGIGIRTIQPLLGNYEVATPMLSTHVLQQGGQGVPSFLDDFEWCGSCWACRTPGVVLTAYSVRSAPASGSSSGQAFGAGSASTPPSVFSIRLCPPHAVLCPCQLPDLVCFQVLHLWGMAWIGRILEHRNPSALQGHPLQDLKSFWRRNAAAKPVTFPPGRTRPATKAVAIGNTEQSTITAGV
jgi:hypothetical protein